MKRFILALLLLVGLSSTAHAAEASIADVKVERLDGLRLSFMVKDAFTKDIEEAIKSGIQTSFTYKVKFYRIRAFWLDANIGSWTFNHTVKYDSLKEEYEITLGESGKVIKTKDFFVMKRYMAEAKDVTLTPIPTLDPASTYSVRVKAELDKVHLPYYLDYIVFFVKLWDFETRWYTHEITS